MKMSEVAIAAGVGVLGGIVGTGAVMVLLKGHMVHSHMRKHITQPMILEIKTGSQTPSTIRISANLITCLGSKKARLILTPFKAAAAGSFAAAVCSVPLPLMAMPMSSAPITKACKMFDADGKATIDGAVSFAPDGTLTITSSKAAPDKGAWGLAESVVIEYAVAGL